MKKTFLMSVISFLMAIAGAFSSVKENVDLCYSKIADVNKPGGEQEELCKARESCDGGPFICSVDFQQGTVFYTGVVLYSLSIPGNETTCTIECTRSTP